MCSVREILLNHGSSAQCWPPMMGTAASVSMTWKQTLGSISTPMYSQSSGMWPMSRDNVADAVAAFELGFAGSD